MSLLWSGGMSPLSSLRRRRTLGTTRNPSCLRWPGNESMWRLSGNFQHRKASRFCLLPHFLNSTASPTAVQKNVLRPRMFKVRPVNFPAVVAWDMRQQILLVLSWASSPILGWCQSHRLPCLDTSGTRTPPAGFSTPRSPSRERSRALIFGKTEGEGVGGPQRGGLGGEEEEDNG